MRPILSVALAACSVGTLLICPVSLSAQLLQPKQGCTVFAASDGDVVLGGNNEDWRDPVTKLWFVPPADGTYGRVYFGFGDLSPQGGMNDQGLFFDGLAVQQINPVPDDDKPVYHGLLEDKVMAECATVECVIEVFGRYNRRQLSGAQLLFADRHGDAVIVEPTAFVRKEGTYLVATNFFQSQTDPQDRTCWRYRTATRMLEDAEEISVELFRDILAATHQSGNNPTQYSNIYDLKNRTIRLYFFHDFEHVVEIDLDAELVKGEHVYDLPAMFPPNERAERWAAPRRVLAEGLQLVRQGHVTDAIAKYLEVHASDSTIIAAGDWNYLCWFGSLWEHAAEVMTACERAVIQDPDVGDYRDSRGVARALTGDVDGAIADFQAFVAYSPNAEARALRANWIQILRGGGNPFTPETLRALREP